MARPATAIQSIDKSELEELMLFYPTQKEASDWFDVSISTLERFIKREFQCSFDVLREKRFVKTRVAIKRAQVKKALSGDNVMLIWCGKQYLGQTDKSEVKNDLTTNGKDLAPQIIITLPSNGFEINNGD